MFYDMKGTKTKKNKSIKTTKCCWVMVTYTKKQLKMLRLTHMCHIYDPLCFLFIKPIPNKKSD